MNKPHGDNPNRKPTTSGNNRNVKGGNVRPSVRNTSPETDNFSQPPHKADPRQQQNHSGQPQNRPQKKSQAKPNAIGSQKPSNKKIKAKKNAKKPPEKLLTEQHKVNQHKPKNSPRNMKKPQQTSPPVPSKPIDKKTIAAANKAMNTRHSQTARKKFRGGNYILYYLLFGFIAVIVLTILANTVLFNCTEIVVNGNSRYLPERIVEVSKIREGDNLLHIDKTKAENKIVEELAYIESADVHISFPTKVVINVEEAETWFCISQYGVTALISRGGKILEKGSYSGLPVVVGYEAASLETGSRLSSKDEAKQSIPEEILNAADKAGLTDIGVINLTDRYDISIEVDGRINLEIGSMTNIDTKLIVASELIKNHIAESESVTILLTNPEKVAVHNNVIDEPSVTPDPEPTPDFDTGDDSSVGDDTSHLV